jgi:hypothetical protein
MNKCLLDGEQAVIAHDESPEVAQPRNAPLNHPALLDYLDLYLDLY